MIPGLPAPKAWLALRVLMAPLEILVALALRVLPAPMAVLVPLAPLGLPDLPVQKATMDPVSWALLP